MDGLTWLLLSWAFVGGLCYLALTRLGQQVGWQQDPLKLCSCHSPFLPSLFSLTWLFRIYLASLISLTLWLKFWTLLHATSELLIFCVSFLVLLFLDPFVENIISVPVSNHSEEVIFWRWSYKWKIIQSICRSNLLLFVFVALLRAYYPSVSSYLNRDHLDPPELMTCFYWDRCPMFEVLPASTWTYVHTYVVLYFVAKINNFKFS